MTERIRVYVFRSNQREHLLMQFLDPLSGKKKTRTCGTANRREALKAAAVWESELQQGRWQSPSKVTWADFRERYENEVLPGLARTTGLKVGTVLDTVERLVSPRLLRDMTADRLSTLQSKLRDEVLRLEKDSEGHVVKVHKRSENTIDGHLAHLRAALQWAANIGLLEACPKIMRPKRAKKSTVMKGRPITTEEFERMLVKVSAVVGAEAARSWEHYLRGLWLSGLRLKESLDLYWDRDDKLCVDLSGRRPDAANPCGPGKGQPRPCAPDRPGLRCFPVGDSRGRPHGAGVRPDVAEGPRATTHCGARRPGRVQDWREKAGVVVNTGKRKFASAHDLRRSFGERWASKVMPQVLRELMRHESIDTTMRFYVGRNAETTADAVWGSLRGRLRRSLLTTWLTGRQTGLLT